jgi:hypothetical protein
MRNTTANTADEYLEALPVERRDAITAVRRVVLKHLPKGYEEHVSFGMLNYAVPLARLPKTYNGQPLCYAALAAQKNYCSLYLMSVYGDKKSERRLRDGFEAAGKKLDIGKSCVRFKSPDDLALDVIGEVIAAIPPDRWIEVYEKSRRR